MPPIVDKWEKENNEKIIEKQRNMVKFYKKARENRENSEGKMGTLPPPLLGGPHCMFHKQKYMLVI